MHHASVEADSLPCSPASRVHRDMHPVLNIGDILRLGFFAPLIFSLVPLDHVIALLPYLLHRLVSSVRNIAEC